MFLSENPVVDLVLLLAVTASLVSMVVALACYLRLRKQAGLTARLFQRLEHELQMSNTGAIGMGKRLMALESQLQSAEASSPAAAIAPVSAPASIDSGLSDAASLLKAGLQPEEVARRCGISLAEASLMQLMQNQVQRANAA